MKITIATGPIYPVPAVLGGSVQRLWHGLGKEFARHGHEVTIFAKSHDGQPEEESLDGIKFVRWGGYDLTTSLGRDLVKCFLYALRACRKVPQGDVVVTNDFWMPALLPVLRLSAGRVVVNANRFPKKQYWLYGRAAAFSAASKAVQEAILLQSPKLAGKVRVIPNCIDQAFLQPRPSSRSFESSGRKAVHILYVGRINPEKGLALLALALRILESRCPGQWRCSLLGPVAEDQGGGGVAYSFKIMERMKGLPVELLSPVYQPQVLADAYDQADVFVYPSQADTGEAMPLAPIEAMARGVVPVVSRLGAFFEYLEPDINGLVFDHKGPDAAQRLATALEFVVVDHEARRRMSEKASAAGVAFSPSNIAKKHLALFEEVKNGRL
jgi:glycosyltransferase involved in cell wall biosynthesis